MIVKTDCAEPMDRSTALVPVHEDRGALGQGAAGIGVTRVGGLDRLLGHYSNNFEPRHRFRFYLYFRIHSKH